MKDPFAVERAIAQTKIKAEKKQSDEFLDTFGKPLLKALKGDLEPLIKANKGADGKTPVKGTDYFTDAEIESIKADVLSRIPTPEDGKDAEVNYDLVFSYVVEQISKLPKPKDGVDGKDAIVDTAQIVSDVLKQIPKTDKVTVDYTKIQQLIDDRVKTIPWNEKRVVGYSSLKQLTDVILTGVPQDSKGNYILTPGGGGGGSSTWGSITGTLADQTDLQDALDAKADAAHTHTASQVTDFNTAADARIAAAAGVSIASLSGGKIPTSQLPALALTDVFTVASQAAQLALTAEEGDVAIRTDLNISYIHNGGTAGTMADWSELITPTDTVLSVNGETGAVTLTSDDISDAGQTNKWATAAEKTKLGHISVTQAVDLDTMESDIATNNAKVSNATHTGEVTGSGALTVDKTAITNKTTVTVDGADYVLISDASDSGNLKKVLASDLTGGGSGITRSVTVTSGNVSAGSTAATDYVYFVAGAHTVSLPAASGNTNLYTIKNNHSANITVDTVGAETLDGTASISLAPEESVQIISDGTNYFIV